MFFEYEGITTQPAFLRIINDYQAEIILTEGKYHQIKRMFGRFRNPVIELKRMAVGPLELDPNLPESSFRPLTQAELQLLR